MRSKYLRRFVIPIMCCLSSFLVALPVSAQAAAQQGTSATAGTPVAPSGAKRPRHRHHQARALASTTKPPGSVASSTTTTTDVGRNSKPKTPPEQSKDENTRSRDAVKARLLRCREHPQICVQSKNAPGETKPPQGDDKTAH